MMPSQRKTRFRSVGAAVAIAAAMFVASGARSAAATHALTFVDRPPPRGSFVLKAKRVYTATRGDGWVYSPGLVIVRDGRIVGVGPDSMELPPDLPVLAMKDGIVTPGLISAATRVIPPHAGDESIAAGYRAVDAFDAYAEHRQALAGGVTTIHLQPGGHRLLTGQGAVVRVGGPASARILRERSDLTINLGEPAFDPPRDVTYQTPASSDVAIPPAVRQRPASRLGQFIALQEALDGVSREPERDLHAAALAAAWEAQAVLRLQAHRGADIAGALRFLDQHDRRGYIVGGAQADFLRGRLAAASVPLVYTVGEELRSIPADVGFDPDVLEKDIRTLTRLRDVEIALAGGSDGRLADLRLAAATARRAGFSERQVIESITRIPAEILGVADRVGALRPGMDADLVVFSDDPLSTSSHAMLVYVAGEVAFEAPEVGALVIRAGTVWVDEQTRIPGGAVLVEDGRITAVGRSVPHPPFARVIDAGPGGFVAPGLIDGLGHLGFQGDRSSTDPDLSPAGIIGVPDVAEKRVARSGVTTVLTGSYSASGQGSQMAAVHSWGKTRSDRVVRGTAAVRFEFQGDDPLDVFERLEKRLKAGQEYLEKWRKYEKELAEWKEKRAKGELDEEAKEPETVQTVETKADPLTGTWAATLSGGPIPEPQSATVKLRLTGNDVEGRMSVGGQPDESRITGTFDGTHLSATIDAETPFGPPAIEADLVEDDHLVGKVLVADVEIDFDARRTDKSAVEFKVTRRRTRGKHGEPLPPPIDESLEPLKAALEKKIPIAVTVTTEAQIAEVLKAADQFDVHLVLVDAEGAAAHAEALTQRSAGVVVGKQIVRRVEGRSGPASEAGPRWYHQADDLSRRNVPIAFQSDAEDGARALPRIGLHAVERGLSPDAALAAFTTQASRMYRLDDQIGSLRAGRLGDMVIFNGHPFHAGSRIERVIIHGEEVE